MNCRVLMSVDGFTLPTVEEDVGVIHLLSMFSSFYRLDSLNLTYGGVVAYISFFIFYLRHKSIGQRQRT